jgi:hypothetical protein
MILRSPDDVTRAVLAEIERAPDGRWREIMSAAVRHLHGFAREVDLTETEFQQACAVIAKLGQLTNESHDEVVLAAGSLGLSSLVCLINNVDRGRNETTANLPGPSGARARLRPPTAGASCARRRPAIRSSSRRPIRARRFVPLVLAGRRVHAGAGRVATAEAADHRQDGRRGATARDSRAALNIPTWRSRSIASPWIAATPLAFRRREENG